MHLFFIVSGQTSGCLFFSVSKLYEWYGSEVFKPWDFCRKEKRYFSILGTDWGVNHNWDTDDTYLSSYLSSPILPQIWTQCKPWRRNTCYISLVESSIMFGCVICQRVCLLWEHFSPHHLFISWIGLLLQSWSRLHARIWRPNKIPLSFCCYCQRLCFKKMQKTNQTKPKLRLRSWKQARNRV